MPSTRLYVVMIFTLYLLIALCSPVLVSAHIMSPGLPHVVNGSIILGSNVIRYMVLALPLVGNSGKVFIAYKLVSGNHSIYIKTNIEGSNAVKAIPESFTTRLSANKPIDCIEVNLTRTGSGAKQAKVVLRVNVTNGAIYNSSSTSVVLAGFGTNENIPGQVIASLVASLSLTVAIPIVMLRASKRRALLLVVLLAATVILVAAPLYAIDNTCRSEKGLALYYIANTSVGPKLIYLYVRGEDHLVETIHFKNNCPYIKTMNKCPAPLCLGKTSSAKLIRGTGFYYMNALRDAIEARNSSFLAYYSSCGYLFLYIDKLHGVSMGLQASTGYEPPLKLSYYVEVLIAPPLLAALFSSVIIYLRNRRRRAWTRQ